MTMTKAEQAVARGRADLLMTAPFFGALAMMLVVEFTTKFSTMATDGRRLLVNPKYAMEVSAEEIRFLWAHEVLHCALKHHVRRGSRDVRMWNVACDYVINLILQQSGFFVPDGFLLDKRFDGMGSEEVYDRLAKKEQKKRDQQQKEQEQQGKGQGGDDAQDQGPGSQRPPEEAEDQDDEGQDRDSDAPGQGGEDEGNSDPDPHTNKDTGDQESNEEANDNDDQADAEGGGQAGGEEQGDDDAAPGSGDSGSDQPGDVIDAPGDATEASAEEVKWEVASRQAAAVAAAQNAGRMPRGADRVIEQIEKSRVDWREVLRRFVTPSSTVDFTWGRLNMRQYASGNFVPGTIADGVNHVAWVIDSSGSMDRGALAKNKAELQEALDVGAIDRLTVVSCDDGVHNHEEFARGDLIEFTPKGGGGTNFRPAFDWLRDNAHDAACVVYFTDLDTVDFGDDPGVPVLWAKTGFSRNVVPFGDVIEIQD